MPINYFEQLQRVEHIFCSELVDEAVLLNIDAGEYHYLNVTAYKLWCWLIEPCSLYDLINKFAAEYDSHPAQLQHDIIHCVHYGLKNQLLRIVPPKTTQLSRHDQYIAPQIDTVDPQKTIQGNQNQFEMDAFETGS